jgi:hypothetical protein
VCTVWGVRSPLLRLTSTAMPTDFRCQHCNLRFSVGPYHYHLVESGYAWCCLMVCKSCGTQHGLEFALRDRGPEFHSNFKITVTAVPEAARNPLAHWLRRTSNKSLQKALELVRNPPVVIDASAPQHHVDAIRAQIEPMGVTLLVEEVERYPNQIFGPLLQDRLRYAVGPQYVDNRGEWLAHSLEEDTLRDALICQHCGSRGVLVAEFEKSERCPACNAVGVIAEAEWIA